MKKTSLKDYLSEFLTNKELEIAPRSFEIVGDIAIIEIPEELESKEKQIGEALLNVNSAIKVVLKKSGIHGGEFRTQDMVHIAGEKRKDTIYQENGIKLKINPETVYFSARLSTERGELMDSLKPNKRVLVMFSGAGPYTFVALRKQPNIARITSIEINPEGHKYALESFDLNKNLLKKSEMFKNIKQFLKENELPQNEKKLIELINNLKIEFINADVREGIENFRLKDFNSEIENYHNELLKQKPADLFKFLKEADFKTLNINLDELEISNDLLCLLVLFSEKFDFICKSTDQKYIFDSNLLKGFLLNSFELKKPFEDVVKYDEIYMPLPKDAELFLDSAFAVADKGAIVHMYDFVHESEFPQKSEDAVKSAAEKFGKKVEILQTRKVGQYSPRKYRVCCDFRIIN